MNKKIEMDNEPGIDQHSTLDQVQGWLQTSKNGFFSEFADLFKRRDGEMMLAYSKQDFEHAYGMPRPDAADLWNALHPVTEEITLVDAERKVLKKRLLERVLFFFCSITLQGDSVLSRRPKLITKI